MNKMESALYNNYIHSTTTNLSDVYGRYSHAKEEAMNYCKRLQHEMKGFDGRICSANTYSFSYAFQYINDDGVVCLCYITKAHNRKFEI